MVPHCGTTSFGEYYQRHQKRVHYSAPLFLRQRHGGSKLRPLLDVNYCVGQLGGRSDRRPDGWSPGRTIERSNCRTVGRSDGQSQGVSDDLTNSRTVGRSIGRTGSRAIRREDRRTVEWTGGRSSKRTDGRMIKLSDRLSPGRTAGLSDG